MTTQVTAAKPPTEVELEFDRGYRAFMLNTGHYALAHAAMYAEGDGNSRDEWSAFAAAGRDDQPETPDYLEAWLTAKQRMLRECNLAGFGGTTPRENTAIRKWLDAHPGQGCVYEDGECRASDEADKVVPLRRSK